MSQWYVKCPCLDELYAGRGLNFRELSSIYETLAAVIFNGTY